MRRRIPIVLLLFLIFTSFTLLEMWLLFTLARLTSIPLTIAVVILSAILGAVMAKREGVAVLARAQKEIAEGRFPAGPLADGVMLLVGGALLVTPGLITDVIGFTTLVGACRRLYSKVLIAWGKRLFVPMALGGAAQGARVYHFGNMPPGHPDSVPPSRQGVHEAAEGSYSSTVTEEEPPREPKRESSAEYVDVEFHRVD